LGRRSPDWDGGRLGGRIDLFILIALKVFLVSTHAAIAVILWFCGNLSGMTLDEFRASLSDSEPPPKLGFALAGLWWDAKGDWARAHESAQQDEDVAGSWVHAYLHRKEGDNSNASYWYSRAGRRPSKSALKEEWEEISTALLAGGE
jgi:hypothetical protein